MPDRGFGITFEQGRNELKIDESLLKEMPTRNRIIPASHLDHFKRYPIMPKSLINQHREGLIIGSACEAGELFQAVVKRKDFAELKRIASWYDFLEIQPLCNNAFMLRKGMVQSQEELKDFNRTIVSLGEADRKSVV